MNERQRNKEEQETKAVINSMTDNALDLQLENMKDILSICPNIELGKKILKEKYLQDKIKYAYNLQDNKIIMIPPKDHIRIQDFFQLPPNRQNPIQNLIQDLINLPSTKKRVQAYRQMSQEMKKVISGTSLIARIDNMEKANPAQKNKIIEDVKNRQKMNADLYKQKHAQVIKNRTTFDNSYQTDLWNCKSWAEVWELHHKIQSQLDDTLIKHFLIGYHYEAKHLQQKGLLKQNLRFMLEMP